MSCPYPSPSEVHYCEHCGQYTWLDKVTAEERCRCFPWIIPKWVKKILWEES